MVVWLLLYVFSSLYMFFCCQVYKSVELLKGILPTWTRIIRILEFRNF
jgi:hypothetical protein